MIGRGPEGEGEMIKRVKSILLLLALFSLTSAVARAQSFGPAESQDSIDARPEARREAVEKQKLWDAYTKKHALPIARNGDAPASQGGIIVRSAPASNVPPTSNLPSGIKVVTPP
jgi:hypothetical protein